LREVASQLDESIKTAINIFARTNVFRKWDGARFEKRLNRAVFDVVANSLADPRTRSAAVKDKGRVLQAFKDLCTDDEFRAAIESTTKSKAAVRNRFTKWFKALAQVTGTRIPIAVPPE